MEKLQANHVSCYNRYAQSHTYTHAVTHTHTHTQIPAVYISLEHCQVQHHLKHVYTNHGGLVNIITCTHLKVYYLVF